MTYETKNYNERVKAKKNRVEGLSAYLKNGRYIFDQNLRTVFNASKTNHPMVKPLNQTNKSDQFSLEIKDLGPKKFNGSILWFCINGDIKIFSDNEVLVICIDEESYQRKMANYTCFSPFFPIPEVVDQDAEHNMLIETYTHYTKKTDEDEAFILNTIYDDYCYYFKNQVLHSNVKYQTMDYLLKTSSNAVYIHQFEQLIDKITPELLSMKFPFVHLHGDLWKDNVLLSDGNGEKNLWYIDWEISDQYLFFYDFFKFMWNELDVHHNDSYYKKYMKGRFDEKLKDVFAIFNLNFQPEFRESYLYLFFLNFMLNDTDNMVFKYKLEEFNTFKRKVLT